MVYQRVRRMFVASKLHDMTALVAPPDATCRRLATPSTTLALPGVKWVCSPKVSLLLMRGANFRRMDFGTPHFTYERS